MSGGAVNSCGNCGAPLDLDDDGRCRWCRAKARPAHPRARHPGGRRPGPRPRWNWRLAAVAAVAVALASALGVGIASQVGSHQSGPPNATGTSDTGVAGSVPPGSTDLQALRQEFGPWRQLTGPATGSPALLLQDGGVYASQRWTVPSTATWWTADLGGNVTNQAFIISGNPDTVLLITPGGTVMSMPLAQATAVRQPLRK